MDERKQYFVVEVTSISTNWDKKRRIIEREMELQFGDSAVVSGPYDAVSVILRDRIEFGKLKDTGALDKIARASEVGSQKNRFNKE